MRVITFCFLLIAKKKSLIVLMEANEDSNEAKLLLLILEQRKLMMAADIQSKRWCLNERSNSYLGCKRWRDTPRISDSIFHKAKVF